MPERRPGPQEKYGGFREILEPLDPEVCGIARRESIELTLLRGVQWIYPRCFTGRNSSGVLDEASAPMPPIPEGTSVSEYAATIPDGIVGFAEVFQWQGTTQVFGKEWPVESERITTGTLYINAWVLSANDAVKLWGARQEVIEDISRSFETGRVVFTRCGSWEPFMPNDATLFVSPSTPQNHLFPH